jgi:hypothetical protein
MPHKIYNPLMRCWWNIRYQAERDGVTVDPLWLKSWPDFRDWANFNGYKDNLQLCRMVSAKGFHPDNCYWKPKAKKRAKCD